MAMHVEVLEGFYLWVDVLRTIGFGLGLGLLQFYCIFLLLLFSDLDVYLQFCLLQYLQC